MGATLSNTMLTGIPRTFTAGQNGWKDTYILMPGEMMKIKAKFDVAGEYVWHCHILSHEDHDMMRKLVVGNPCATDATPSVLSACPTNLNLTTTGTYVLICGYVMCLKKNVCWKSPTFQFCTIVKIRCQHFFIQNGEEQNDVQQNKSLDKNWVRQKRNDPLSSCTIFGRWRSLIAH